MYMEKVNLLKVEYFKVEAKSQTDNAEIRAKLAVARERLENYDDIEQDINSAIEKFGEERGEDELLNTLQFAPTSGKRRIQHSMELAKKLSKKQSDVESYRKQLAE